MSTPNWIQDHIELYKKDPEAGHMWDSTVVGGPGPLPCLLLTTTGRKSGKQRTLPLLYTKLDDGFVIIASKGGAPKHPFWYLNLTADPNVEIQVAADIHSCLAEEVKDDRRDPYWQAMAKIWPDYENYQKKTDRKIPVIFLKPKS